jgi:hypothetical protein
VRVAGEKRVYRQNLPIYPEPRYPIMHRDDYSRANLFNCPAEVFEFYRRRTPDQGQQDVHPTLKPMQLLLGERVARVPHVEDADSPQLEAVHRVLVRILLVLDALYSPEGLEGDTPTSTVPDPATSSAFRRSGSPGIIAALEWYASVVELTTTTSAGSSTGFKPETAGS